MRLVEIDGCISDFLAFTPLAFFVLPRCPSPASLSLALSVHRSLLQRPGDLPTAKLLVSPSLCNSARLPRSASLKNHPSPQNDSPYVFSHLSDVKAESSPCGSQRDHSNMHSDMDGNHQSFRFQESGRSRGSAPGSMRVPFVVAFSPLRGRAKL